MEKYILAWEVNDYPDNGGGIEVQKFDNDELLLEKVNEIKQDKRIEIIFCYKIAEEIKFKAVEKVTRWEIE